MTAPCFVNFPFFDLGEFVLREVKESDALHYLNYMSSTEVKDSVPDYLIPNSLAQSVQELRYWKNLFEIKRGFFWAIAKKTNNKLVGTIGFNFLNLNSKKGEINYDLNPEYWSKGIVSSALKKVMEFSAEIGLVRVQATVLTDNKRSISVLERAEFELEGVLRNYEYLGGLHRDSYMYAKLFTNL